MTAADRRVSMKKSTPFGEIEVCDAHCHFFSHKFFETLIGQSATLSKEADPITRAGELTGWVMPPRDPAELGKIWSAELNKHDVSTATLIASVLGDEASVAAAVAAFP